MADDYGLTGCQSETWWSTSAGYQSKQVRVLGFVSTVSIGNES